MSQSSLGAIIVGTQFGVLTHLRALRGAGIDVRALVGRDPDKTAKRAARVGVDGAFTSLTEALALPNVDLVTVATPSHTHGDIVLEAIAAGKHVLCEKPFASDAADARRMYDAAEEAGIVHMFGTEFRFSTGQALAVRAIHDGIIGEPRLATVILNVPVLADPAGEVPGWWSDASQGGGWLGAYASHNIDQLRTMLGEFAGVSASACARFRSGLDRRGLVHDSLSHNVRGLRCLAEHSGRVGPSGHVLPDLRIQRYVVDRGRHGAGCGSLRQSCSGGTRGSEERATRAAPRRPHGNHVRSSARGGHRPGPLYQVVFAHAESDSWRGHTGRPGAGHVCGWRGRTGDFGCGAAVVPGEELGGRGVAFARRTHVLWRMNVPAQPSVGPNSFATRV